MRKLAKIVTAMLLIVAASAMLWTVLYMLAWVVAWLIRLV